MSQIQQIFKNRAEALRFVQDWRYPFKERTFYNFCDNHKLVETDGKSIKLCNLIAALWEEYPPIQQSSDQAQAEFDARRSAKLDLEKKELEVEKLRRADDHVKNLEKQVAENRQQLAGLLLYFYHTVKYHLGKCAPFVVAALGAEASRGTEVAVAIEEYLDRAMNEIAQNKKQLQIEVADDEKVD
jgi:hypothetical protein